MAGIPTKKQVNTIITGIIIPVTNQLLINTTARTGPTGLMKIMTVRTPELKS